MRYLRSIPLVSTVGLLLLLVGAAQARQKLDSQSLFEMHEPAVYQIRVIHRETGKKTSIGSGFVFASSKQLATNYHVVSTYIEKPETYDLSYLGSDGRQGKLELIAVDVVHDLALVEAGVPLGTPLEIKGPPPKGAALFAMGNPLDLGQTIAAGTNGGILPQTDDGRILFSGSLNPGMSGGPTFDDSGAVVGINVATARNAISFIVPARYLRELAATPAGSSTSPAQIGRQIIDYQQGYLEKLSGAAWPSTPINEMQVPGAISPTIRCWDASPDEKPEHLYRRLRINCENENEVFLTDKLEVGKIGYEYAWLESDQLDPVRFHRLYQALNDSQFSSRAGKDEVGHFTCDTRFVETNGLTLKASFCHRPYLKYTGISDVLFTSAMVGRKNRGFIFNLDLSGTDAAASVDLIEHFLGEISWQD